MTLSSFIGELALFLLCWNTCLSEPKKKLKVFPLEHQDVVCITQPCPDSASPEWRRLQDRCCPSGGYFHCQINDWGVSRRLCMEPVECLAGYFADLMPETLAVESLCLRCPMMEFQPSPTLSHHFIRNHCSKSFTACPEQSQIIRVGNATSDYLCKCPYLQGYRPVTLGDHDCRVFVSSSGCASGCACRHDPCPAGQILNSTDYECIQLTEKVLEMMQKENKETQALYQDNMKILQQRKEHLEHVVHMASEMMKILSPNQDDSCKPIIIPFGVGICGDDDKSPHPVLWIPTYRMYSTSSTPGLFADRFVLASNKDNSVHLPFSSLVPVAAFTVLFACSVLAVQHLVCNEKGRDEPHVYVRVFLTTKNAMAVARKEIKNILPFLERHYGCSVVSVNSKKRHITIFVRQGQGLTPFPVHALVRDLLSPLSIRNLKSSENEVDRPLRVVVLTGMSADLQEINRAFSTASFPDNAAHDTGEINLRFPEKKTEKDVFKKLQTTRQDMSAILSKHGLLLQDIQEGSIHFKFRLKSPRESLDELAHNQRIIRITEDFFSHEIFGKLASSQKVTAEYVCNVNMEKVSVLTAKTLHVLIGKRNKVKVVAAPGLRADHTDDDQHPGESYVIHADDSVDVTAVVTSAVTLHATPRSRQQKRVPVNGGPGTSLKPHQIRIVVLCKDDSLASGLHKEWSNVLPLLLNHHHGWTMTKYGSRIVWERKKACSIQSDQLHSLLYDLLSTERVRHLVEGHFPRFDVYVGEEPIIPNTPPEERQQVQPWHIFMMPLLHKINDCYWVVMNFCYRLVMNYCHLILLVIIVPVLIYSFYINFVSYSIGL